MEKSVCISCFKPKATLECGACHSTVCKYCAQFVEEETFSFLGQVPEDLAHSTYCPPCFNEKVQPKLDAYNHTMELAKEIDVYYKKQSKETRLIKRFEDPVHVQACSDRDETILRLAFFAAQRNFNSIVDVQVSSVKVKMGSYQNLSWSGTGIPAQVLPDRIIKDRSFSTDPN
jgi:hypothetical protein